MAKAKSTSHLEDAVQRYVFEVLHGQPNNKVKDEINHELVAALYEARPEAAEGPEVPPEWPVAESVPEESVSEDA